MTNNLYIPLNNRAIISVSGNDSATFLQGLITNDIKKVSSENAIYALMLTPQGKYLYDFFITMKDETYYIDCSSEHIDTIIKKFSMYKLRSDVKLAKADEYEAVALIGEKVVSSIDNVRQFCKGVAYIDPRSDKIFARAIIERENEYQSFKAYEFAEGDICDYEQTRISLGIPSGDNDLVSGDSFPLDFSMNELNAIDYKKGCYVGQEVTARVNYRGKIRKKVYRLQSEENWPEYGTKITIKDSKSGHLLSSVKNIALALLRIEDVEKNGNECNVGAIKAKITG